MFAQIRAAFVLLAFSLLLFGGAYPWAMTGLANALFPQKAEGSLISVDGKIVGSTLLAQAFTSQKYFYPRPSAAGSGYDGLASGASNLAPSSGVFQNSAAARLELVSSLNHLTEKSVIPPDMITASGSGLDPHISIAAANIQAERVATARDIPTQKVKAAIAANTELPTFGFLGEARVNVLKLNLSLDQISGQP